MGCLSSTPADPAPAPRKRAEYEPPAPTPVSHTPAPAAAAVVPVPLAASQPSPVQAVPSSSLPKRTTPNAALYATSIDRRVQEVEFFRNIVKRTEDDFVDVSQSAMDYHEDEESDDGGLGVRVRAIPVQPERMDFAGIPRPSPKNQENLTLLLSGGGLAPARLAAFAHAAAAIAAAVESIELLDHGKSMVMQFPAASM